MVRDHPLVGVGPNMVPEVVRRVPRRPTLSKPINPHLHNVPVQIAAERGLPALAAWICVHRHRAWSISRASSGPAGHACSPPRRSRAVVSMLAAGLFEYNFGDSEFLMLFLLLITLPFAAARESRATAHA